MRCVKIGLDRLLGHTTVSQGESGLFQLNEGGGIGEDTQACISGCLGAGRLGDTRPALRSIFREQTGSQAEDLRPETGG